MEKAGIFHAVGKRKTSVARIWARQGSGKITVNKRSCDEYFPTLLTRALVFEPLKLTNTAEAYDFDINVCGGGVSGQAAAVRHGLTRVLMEINPELRPVLKKAGLITRDPRIKERKKYGHKKARKSFQFSKR